MNIWNILKIEPTTDKKLIKRAYAQQSRKVHPEEKPEEFQVLYEAYQRALEYAEKGRMPAEDNTDKRSEKKPEKWFEQGAADWHTKETKEEEQDLTEFFSEKLKRKSACMEKFNQAWDRLCRRYGLSGEDEQWEAFLESEEFKEIQMDPQVMVRIAQGLNKKLKYEDRYHLALWEAYDFTEGTRDQYDGEERLLYDSLSPVIEKKRREREKKEAEYRQAEIDKKRRKDFIKAGIIAVCCFCAFGLLFGYLKVMQKNWAISGYMNRKYAGIEFTKPQDQKRSGSWGERFYILHPADQPELNISLILWEGGSGGSKAVISDDYGEQLIQQYGEPFGLKVNSKVDTWYGSMDNEIYFFYYEAENDIRGFCRSFYELLKNREEDLSFVKQVGFCPENICFPEIMIEERREGLWENLTFSINDLPQPKELEDILRKSYVEYMYHYEAWNLTPAQEAEYGPEYIAEGRKKEEESEDEGSFGPWSAIDDLRKTEQEAGLYLPVHKERNYQQNQYTGTYTYTITPGNAYQYLKARGLPVSATQDGRGFTVEVQEDTYEFTGTNRMKLNEVYELAQRAGKSCRDTPF